MIKKTDLRRFVIRGTICFLLALVFVAGISEIAFLMQKDRSDRAAKTIELVIPLGTANQVEAGKAVATIPQEMSFVMGDVLIVKNEDHVDHQLGPVWVPPGSSASLVMEKPDKYAYTCSFQPTRYLGLNVRKPMDWGVRLTGLGFAVPPTTVVLFLYSLLLVPLDQKKVNGEEKDLTTIKPSVEPAKGEEL